MARFWRNTKLCCMSRINAFTILELLVVMVISSILLAIAYQALDITQTSYWRYYSANRDALHLKSLMTTLRNDFEAAQAVVCSSDEMQCVRGEQLISYRFGHGMVTRRIAQEEETFPFEATEIRYFFDGVERRPIRELADEAEISFRFNRETVVLPLKRHKAYFDHFQQWASSE
jgi:prepilin-type N-terminal cleavage/methylation domain-containing protein